MGLQGKKLLVLGGTYSSYDLVKAAKELGVHTVVTDYYDSGLAKSIADEQIKISTADIESLSRYVQNASINGVFCGPSEFNIRNMIKLTEATGLPCYTNMALWDQCANKDEFTVWCRKYGVDVPPEYDLRLEMTDSELRSIDYPIIVKPVDGSSSVGITVCSGPTDVLPAYKKAMDASTCKRIITEKYIDNGGEIFGVRYLVRNGEAFPYLLIDTYVVDPVGRKCLISAFSRTPSQHTEYYLSKMDAKVRAMIKGMGIQNGTVFFQALPYKGKIYFHEMGFRLSGGLLYKITEPLMGINDMKMMIRFALGGDSITDEEVKAIDLYCHGRVGAQLTYPLNAGTINRISGLEDAIHLPNVTDFLQYYREGDTVKKESIGTLRQHFGRFTFIADSLESILDQVEQIQQKLMITDSNNEPLHYLKFDCGRVGASSGS